MKLNIQRFHCIVNLPSWQNAQWQNDWIPKMHNLQDELCTSVQQAYSLSPFFPATCNQQKYKIKYKKAHNYASMHNYT